MTSPVSLTFLGAAGTVTGSKTLLATPDARVLVDCGLFQGERELRRRNWQPLPIDPDALHAVALTHAHLDHCGYLPKLHAEGFTGPTYTTSATAELAAIVLMDSAHLLEEEARHASTYGWSKHPVPLPLYDQPAAARAISHLTPVEFRTDKEIAPGLSATWHPAGHILGSATITFDVSGTRVLFSGDLGRSQHPLLHAPDPPDDATVVVVESTYGDRVHPELDLQSLADVINRTVARGGSVLVPAFAVDRTEVVLAALDELRRAGRIPAVPVVLDSPMALRALDVYRAAISAGSLDSRPGAAQRFDLRDVQALATVEESRRMNSPDYPCIIISASGMATGGRVLHHLRHQLPDPRHTVLLAGYQAAGTRGRALLEGARTVKLFGQYVPVRAEIAQVQGLSVHADVEEILSWLGRMSSAPEVCFVTHGEPTSSARLRDRIEQELGWTAVVPRSGERVLVRS
jgi:metallo-beta-lactamase family protein